MKRWKNWFQIQYFINNYEISKNISEGGEQKKDWKNKELEDKYLNANKNAINFIRKRELKVEKLDPILSIMVSKNILEPFLRVDAIKKNRNTFLQQNKNLTAAN